jgi:hypothetical protein
LKQGLPSFAFTDVAYSADEHFVALSDTKQIVIYDLLQAQELRRVILHGPSFPRPRFAFAQKTNTLYVRDGDLLLECELEGSLDCKPLPSDLGIRDSFKRLEVRADIKGQPSQELFQLFGSPAGIPADEAYQFGALSPKRDLVLYTQQNAAYQTLLYLGHPGTTIPPDILAASGTLAKNVEFVHNYPAILVHGVGSQLWDLRTGQIKGGILDGRYSGDNKVSVGFVPHLDGEKVAGADLWRQDNTLNKVTQTSLHVPKMPSWYGVSTTGEVVVYELPPTAIVSNDGSARSLPDGKIQAFTNGAIKELPCTWRSGRATKPSIDSSGTVFSAICDRRNESNSTGATKSLVRWRLPSLQEIGAVPVENSLVGASLSPDGSSALLCYYGKLQLANLSTRAVTDIPLSASFRDIHDCQMQKDGHSVVLAFRERGTDKVGWFDIADKSTKSSIPVNPIFSLTTDEFGNAAVLTDDGIVSLFDRSGFRRARLVPLSSQDWLVFSDTGFFDGTPNAFKWAAYRTSPASPLIPASTLFNELYTPGLLPLLVDGQAPHLPDGLALSTLLELPGVKTLLQSGGAMPILLDGNKAVVCFSRRDVFQALNQQFAQSPLLVSADSAHPNCQDRIELSDQSHPQLTVDALTSIKNNRFVTPWDGQYLSAKGTVHLLTVAVGEYAHIDEPPIHTAVPAVVRLETLLKARFAGENLVDWDERCGGPLHNAAATKSAILGCLDKMIPDVKADDMVMLVFAGHGGNSAPTARQSELFYFYPADVTKSADGLDNAISSAELAEKVRSLQVERLVVVMDACDSGAMMPPLEGALAARLRETITFAGQGPNASPSTHAGAQGVLLIAASAGVEKAIAGEIANPFLDRLKDVLTPKDGQSTMARDIANKMSAPLLFDQGQGLSITTSPVAIQIGADFALTGP